MTAINPKLIKETPIALPSIKYSSLTPGNPARKITKPHAAAAINLKTRFPHKRPAAQIPMQVAAIERIRPTGGRKL
jgi:hypothetical protein